MSKTAKRSRGASAIAIDRPDVWRRFVALVMDARADWRRKLQVVTGLPFGRVHLLRQLLAGELTQRELADAAGADAPATTVLVVDLERRGLVQRRAHPTSGRTKLVSLTAAGRAMLKRVQRALDEPPSAFDAISATDAVAFSRIIDQLHAGMRGEPDARRK